MACIRHLQIVVSIGGLQVLVLEERGRGKNDVGVVGGVGEELLVHHGEQVRTLQSANHLVVVGTNRRRIRVVNEERLDRADRPACSAPAQFHHVDGARRPSQSFLHQVGALERVFVQVQTRRWSKAASPPPTSFHEPVMQGSMVMARVAMPPPSERCTP